MSGAFEVAGMSPSGVTGAATGHDARYELRAVLLLSIGFGLVGLDRWMITPLAPMILKDLRLDYQDLGNLGAAVGLSWGVFAIIMGRLADSVRRKAIIIPAVIGFSLLAGVSGLATGFMGLFLARLAMGVAEGAYCPSSYAAALDASHPKRRGLNLGVIQGAFALFGLALGPIIATQLVAAFNSWRAVFFLVSIPGLVLAGVLAFALRDVDRPAPVSHERTNWRAVLAYRNIKVSVVAIFASMSGIFVIGVMAPVFLTDVIGLDAVTMGFVMSGLGLGGFIGQIAIGAISDRIGRKPTLVLSFLLGAAALLALVYAAHAPMGLFAALFVSAFCCCGANALLAGPVPGESVPATMVSTAMGLTVGLGEIFGGGVAPAVGGAIATSAGLPATILTVAGVLVVGALLSLLLEETVGRA